MNHIIQFAEVRGEVACGAFEEFDEVGGIVETKFKGYLLDHHIGVADETFGLQHNTLVDECQWRGARTFVDAFAEGTDGSIEGIGIFLDGMQTGVLLLYQSTELHEETMLGLEFVELLIAQMDSVTLHLDQEDTKQRLQHVDVAKLPYAAILLLHLLYEGTKDCSRSVVDTVVRQGIEGVECVVLQKEVAHALFIAHEVGTHLDSDTPIGLIMVEVVHLSGREEEDGVGLNGILGEVDGVSALSLLKPQNLIEGVDMRRGVVDVAVEEEVRHTVHMEPIAAGSVADGLIASLQLVEGHDDARCLRLQR